MNEINKYITISVYLFICLRARKLNEFGMGNEIAQPFHGNRMPVVECFAAFSNEISCSFILIQKKKLCLVERDICQR